MGPCILPEPTPETLRACQVHTEQSAAQNWTGLWPQDQSQEGQDEVQTGEPHTHPSPDVGGGSSSLQGADCEPTGRLAHASLAWPWRGDPCGWMVLTLSPCHLHRAGGKGMRGSPAGLLCGAARLGLPEAPGQLETPRLREGGGDREKERRGLYSLRAPPADSWQGHHTSVLQPQGAGCSPPRSASPGTGSSTGCLDENTALLTP